ncbi:uncharacterized protein LOC134775546 [Penaeus indicus]|uniref:uncharacterized protein LOC134775546 n=1 Tax=Penaeus indicus TaxID=29960 RepID=UPI00300C393E
MHLLPLWALAIAGWVAAVAAAPGPRPQEGEDLLPALKDLARRKRAGNKSNLPYSNYRPLSGMHRYRYPIYRKRSSRPQPQYDYEEDLYIPEPEGDFLDYEESLRGPSLFRERSLQQQDRRKKEMLMEDEGYFSDDFLPEKKFLPSPYVVPLVKKDTMYNLANTPYDLQAIGRLYEVGKRDSNSIDPYNLEALQDAHSVDRKSIRPTPTEQFYDAIDAIAKKNVYVDESDRDAAAGRVAKLRNFLTSAAGRYWRARDAEETSARDPLIRKKRTVAAPTVAAAAAAPANKTNATTDTQSSLSSKVPARYHAQFSGDRKKRAFSDYFKWDRRKKSQPEEEDGDEAQQKRSSPSRDYDDYLTREYFKSIARSVGQKKRKRMAYAQFEADKRSSGIDEFLENPSMLQYMQAMLKEAEEKVTSEAEEELGQTDGENENQRLLGNIVVRLDALERMREALGQLEALQEQEERQQQEEEVVAGQAKRTQALTLPALPHKRQLSTPQEEAARRRKSLQEAAKRKESEGKSARRRMRRGEAALSPVFLGNAREECPVLERILMNCVAVSNEVGDQDKVFLDTCVRHEICYMCGSGLRISGHECDAVLSSSLEAACSSNLDCLGAAGETFNILSDASRYDQDGICTHDPCVRQFLEMR